MSYRYVAADEFTPESKVNWQPVGKVKNVVPPSKTEDSSTTEGFTFTLEMESGHKIIISFLSAQTFRVRFCPDLDAQYDQTRSPASICDLIASCELEHNAMDENSDELRISTGEIEVRVNKNHYALSVYKEQQLIHADLPDYNLVYIPGEEVIANFKRSPSSAYYFGFGEKAGTTLDKKRVPSNHFFGGEEMQKMGARLTFFNYDNFHYMDSDPPVVPEGEVTSHLNPNVPLYQSSPFLLECNPKPTGDFAGDSYCYGILFDNTSQSYFNLDPKLYSDNFDEGDSYYFGALSGELDYYFFAGDNVTQVLNQATKLTGGACLKPKYVFGYHQGGYGDRYNKRNQLLDRAKEYRAHQIPIDGLHIDVDFQNNLRTFTHSEKNFPDPKGMFDELQQSGFKCSTNITPIISIGPDEDGNDSTYKALESGKENNVFVVEDREGGEGNGEPFVGQLWYGGERGTRGHYPDLGRIDNQEWWGEQYEDLVNWGIDMIWQDMTSPAMDDRCQTNNENCPNALPWRSFPLELKLYDNEESRYSEEPFPETKQPFAKIRNVYNYNLVRATYNGLEKLRTKRNFIIARGGYFGFQRYAGLWTGDNGSTWEFLRLTIPQVLNQGLTGIAVSGSDIGGFRGERPSPEMIVRWTMLGAFLPWFRNHYDCYNGKFEGQEPYTYDDPAVLPMCRKYIELRYRLIQVLYDAMYENTLSGKPIMRPLFFNEIEPGVCNDDPGVYENHDWWYGSYYYNTSRLDDQFFLGNDILVCPIVYGGYDGNPQDMPTLDRPVYLPAGSKWYSFKDNKLPLDNPEEGGQEFNYRAPWNNYQEPYMNNIPVYIREGAIVPMREVEQYVGELNSKGLQNTITFNIYPGKNSTYTLYLDDDGNTRNAEDPELKEYRLTEISHEETYNGDRIQSKRVRIKRVHDNYTPEEKYFYISLLGVNLLGTDVVPKQVIVGTTGQPGDTLTEVVNNTNEDASAALADSSENAYYYNTSVRSTFIKVFDNADDITVEVTF